MPPNLSTRNLLLKKNSLMEIRDKKVNKSATSLPKDKKVMEIKI